MAAETEQPVDGPKAQQPERLRRTLLTSSEGRVLLAGVALASAYILWLGVKLLVSPDEFQDLIGLFAFVWFPFWMTGPVVGCVIGFLLGLRAWVNIAVVLSGTYLAILAWGLFLSRFHDSVAAYSSQAAMVLMILLIVIIVAGSLLHGTLRETKHKN